MLDPLREALGLGGRSCYRRDAMRRSSANCGRVAEEQQSLLAALDRHDVLELAGLIEPFVTEERRARLRQVFASRLDSVTVLMDAPHDPHNGGAVLRSCDAFGVQRLHILERVETFLASRTVARGAERWVDVRCYSDLGSSLEALQRSGHELVATHPDGELLPSDLASIPRLALVLGNERHGIDAELASVCRHRVRVPMRGFVESLNVSVTGAILLEQATHGRPGDLAQAERDLLYARALVLTVPHAPDILRSRGFALDLPAPV